MKIEWGEV